MNSLEHIDKNLTLENPTKIIKWLETLDGENVKWKHHANANQLVLKTDNYYYKFYAFNEIDKFNSIIRHAFAEVYQSYGIKWDIVTVKTDTGFLDIERREKLEECKEWSDDILLNYADTLNLVEKKLEFDYIKDQIKQKYKYVNKLKLVRQCANKAKDYAIYKNKIILLDDADWYLVMLDNDYKIINMNNTFIKINLFDEYYTFTRSVINPQKSLTMDKVHEISDKFFLFKSLDFIKREARLRQDFQNMLRNNIDLLVSKETAVLYNEETALLCSPFKKIFYCSDKIEKVDFDIYNKFAIQYKDILNNREVWDNACYQYVSQNISSIYLYFDLYGSIDELCELLDEAKICSVEPINGFGNNTGIFLYVQWNILNDNVQWEENFDYIKQHYPKVKIVINIILNEPFLNKVNRGDIDISTFKGDYGAIIQYGTMDDTPKEFYPRRKSMLKFLNMYTSETETYLKIFKTDYGFDKKTNKCGHNRNNFLPYYDSDKCCICDWKIIGNML